MVDAGADSTEELDTINSFRAQCMLNDYCIGELDTDETVDDDSTVERVYQAEVLSADPKKVSVTSASARMLTYNMHRLRFALPTRVHVLGLLTGVYVLMCTKVDDKLVVRAYISFTAQVQPFAMVGRGKEARGCRRRRCLEE